MHTYLFDWGDTLMRDFPQFSGKMCDWPKVEAMPYAKQVLSQLKIKHQIYVATGAKESAVKDIDYAFERCGLATLVDGYFCPANLGYQKGQDQYLEQILTKLQLQAAEVTMVGDSWQNDIEPARRARINCVWIANNKQTIHPNGVRSICDLRQLLD